MRFLLVLLLACSGTQRPATPPRTLGAIAGLARDRTSGEVISMADIEVGDRKTKSNIYGMYELDDMKPGTYTVVGRFADQPVTVRNVVVSPGLATYVDIGFTLGDSTPIDVDYGDPRAGEIQRFKTKVPRIEGTVGDAGTRERIAGAVVTAVSSPENTLQTLSDEHGRYRFDVVPTGTYAVSAYYSIGGRAQIEVRRSDIEVSTNEGVFVPLWIELAKQ